MASKFKYTKLDMYSKTIGFYYDNQEKIGSYFGLFLTIIYIFTSLILFFYEFINIIQRSEFNVYDSTIYPQETPYIEIDINQLYFAFALEDPITNNRFIDERIYTAQIAFIDKQKIKDKFETINKKSLDYEKCNLENFGKEYQHLFMKDELSNSYCLKNFNYTLSFGGTYKHERFKYIRIRIFPCVNSTKNNFTCRSQKDIDYYMSSGYFSIVLKDFGLNPSNYSHPVIPTLQDIFTTIDRRIHKNLILNLGVTEIHTDTGIINKKISIKKYLQFRKGIENFTFREQNDYYAGKSVILVQLRLDDIIFVQKRSYPKMSQLLSKIGGYMQIIYTFFLLITSIINKLNNEIKIINSIFDFNLKEKKMILKLKSIKEFNQNIGIKINNNLEYSPDNKLKTKKQEFGNKSKNNLIIEENNIYNISPMNISDNKKINENQNYIIKINNKKNFIGFGNSNSNKSINEISNCLGSGIKLNKDNLDKCFFDIDNKDESTYKNYKDHIKLSLIDYLCSRKNSKKYKYIELYNKSNTFFKKKIDIVRVFTLLSIVEDKLKR
jgi:hypothetical protein